MIRKWLAPVGIGLGVVALVLIALNRQAPLLDYDTPEGAVQEYLRAISVSDFEAAFAVLEPDRFEGCEVSDIERNLPAEPFSARLSDFDDGFVRDFGGPDEPSGFTEFPQDSVTVNVIFEFGTPGLFGGTWENWESFQLVEHDDDWWITGDPWPYFSWGCRQVEG